MEEHNYDSLHHWLITIQFYITFSVIVCISVCLIFVLVLMYYFANQQQNIVACSINNVIHARSGLNFPPQCKFNSQLIFTPNIPAIAILHNCDFY